MSYSILVTTGRAALIALGTATMLSCTTGQTGQTAPASTAVGSAGRGAAVSPAIAWEMWRKADDIEAFPFTEIKGYPEKYWLVGPFDPGSAGKQEGAADYRLNGFLGSAQNG